MSWSTRSTPASASPWATDFSLLTRQRHAHDEEHPYQKPQSDLAASGARRRAGAAFRGAGR